MTALAAGEIDPWIDGAPVRNPAASRRTVADPIGGNPVVAAR
ncbi:MAG TPA: hypothetical protein VMU51_15385 [Mycobacteriales bacterium]|nr:hypothetical protein [Mycobacteriales bacterium]